MTNSCPCWQQLRFGSKGWHPFIVDTIGNQQFCVPDSAVSGEFPVGMVLGNRAVEHNMASFLELSLAVQWREKLNQSCYYE